MEVFLNDAAQGIADFAPDHFIGCSLPNLQAVLKTDPMVAALLSVLSAAVL